MKSQAKTILLFLIYSISIFSFCYWYKEVAKLSESRHWIDLGPILRYMLFSGILNFLFFFAVKVTHKIPVELFSYLTTRAIGLALSFYIIAGFILPTTIDEFYLFTGIMTATTLFLLIKEKLIIRVQDDHMCTT